MQKHYKLWIGIISNYFIADKHKKVTSVLTDAASSDDAHVIVRVGFILVDGCDGEYLAQGEGSSNSPRLVVLRLRQVCLETTDSEYDALVESVHK